MDNRPIEKTMSVKTFSKFKKYIEENIGICMPEAKKVLVESRLLKRLRVLNFQNYDDYSDYFFSSDGERNEVARFIECITTNKTDFFREDDHFTYLENNAFNNLINKKGIKDLRLWSAASSSGEEAYTMAMVSENYLEKYPGVGYKILATDISEKVLNSGRQAIYSWENSAPIPTNFKKKYCLKSKDPDNHTIRISKKLRKKVAFSQINLTDSSYNIQKEYHIIFLRNVMIYFNQETQCAILKNLYKHLYPEGYLFLGHSENIPELSLPFKRVGPSIYVKKENNSE